MRHNRGQFVLVLSQFDQAAVDINGSTGKADRIDVSRIDDSEAEGNSRLRQTASEPLTD
jgi:hypothetical protein